MSRNREDGILLWRMVSLAIFIIFILSQPSFSTLKIPREVEIKRIERVAILPFINYTDNPEAPERVEVYIRKELARKGIQVVDNREVEDFLARKRIRYTGGITRLNAREMGKTLRADAILVGSVDLFADIGGEVYSGVSLRLVSTVDGSIVWANSLSYSGRDFEGILGLGLITSLDTLTQKVVAGLLEGIPATIPVDNSRVTPFEVEEVEIYPGVVKGGDKVEVRVRFHPFIEEPSQVKAKIGREGVVLKLIRGNELETSYEGSLRVPSGEGVHLIDIVASSDDGATYPFPAAGKVMVDNTPPRVEIEANRKVFAPRRKGYVLLRPRLLSYDQIDQWRIEIVDEKGRVVRSDKGYGRLPLALIWKGENNALQMVKDGRYTYRFVTVDPAGNTATLSDTLRVKNKPPSVDISVEKEGDKLIFSFDYDPDEAIKEWEVILLSPEGREIKVMRGKGDLPRRFEYPLIGGMDVRKLSFSIDVRDEADNHFKAIEPLSTALRRKKAPFAERRKVLKDF